jgi:YesN/AraC family two-component response regulator
MGRDTVSIRILVVDDESMIRRGFRMILESESGMEVVAEASDGEQAIAAARRFSPH